MESATTELAHAEARVEAHSAELKKELGVRDLALTQILFIIGLTWIGVAGKLGPSHVVMWLLAAVLFYLPLTVVVIWLNQLMPLEGGLYQWAKLGFNQTIGFMVAWNLWLYVILFASELGLTVATYLSYALGPRAAWMTSSTWFVSVASALAIALLATLAFVGLSLTKWVHNAGGAFMITIFACLILLPFLGIAGTLVTIAIVMTLAMRVSQISVAFTAVTRLPMVAGWDRLLPAWFSRLHRAHRTPVNSILVVAVFSFVMSVISLAGVGQAEAFQLMFNASGIFYGLTYLVMFAIPLVGGGLRGVTTRPPWWVKASAASGFVITVLYTVLSLFPIIQVGSVAAFAL